MTNTYGSNNVPGTVNPHHNPISGYLYLRIKRRQLRLRDTK